MKIRIFFLFLLTFASLAAKSNNSCDRFYRENSSLYTIWSANTSVIARIRTAWNPLKFSDPRKHDSKKFTYIVRVVSLKESFSENIARITNLHQREEMSASVINERHRRTFGTGLKSGLILHVPEENILFSNPWDMALGAPKDRFDSGNVFDPNMASLVNKPAFGLHSPEQLLKESSELNAYNEVLVKGGNNNPTTVVGLFYIPELSSSKAQNEIVSQLEKIAEHLDIPLIKIYP